MATITTAQSLTDLHAELLADAGIAAVIGTRLYAIQARQNAVRPYAVYNVINNTMSLTHDGDASQTRLPIQIDVYGDTALSAIEAADAIKTRLVGLVVLRGNTLIQVGILDTERTDFEPGGEFERISMDFDLLFARA